jgi:hypothetical protein
VLEVEAVPVIFDAMALSVVDSETGEFGDTRRLIRSVKRATVSCWRREVFKLRPCALHNANLSTEGGRTQTDS